MRVMVTGGAGYIGSVVTETLLEGGHGVLVYDNLVKGHRDAVPAGAAFVEGDLLDGRRLRAALQEHQIEAVIHMAAHSLVGESVLDPAKYYRNNVEATLELLEALRACAIQRLVFSSTAAVYGEPVRQPIEETDPTAPSNPYGEAKLACEAVLRWYAAPYGLRSVSLRYFNAAGATAARGERHDPETHLIPLVLQVAAGQRREVEVFGTDYPTPDGTCVRDYVHVADLAEAHVLCLDALSRPEEAPQARVYNLGCGGSGYSVRQVIDAARAVTGRAIAVREGPRRPGDPSVLLATARKISRELGWHPRRQDLRAILASAWRFLQTHGPAQP